MIESIKPIVIFRADGHSKMGLGHLYRSAALANMLKAKYDCWLAYAHCPVTVTERFKDTFSQFVQLADEQQQTDAARTLVQCVVERAGEDKAAIVVLDGYHFGTDFQQVIHDAKYLLVCVDDIHAYTFLADLVVNHAPIDDLRAKYQTSPHTAFALGLDFALLRPLYLAAAQRAYTEKRKGDGFLICFGGSDANNISGQLINWLKTAGFTQRIDVILGAAASNHEDVAMTATSYPGPVTVHHNLDDEQMIALYDSVALAFLPASTTLIEALACRVPVVGGYYVANQRDIYHGLVAQDAIRGVGDWNDPQGLTEQITAALNSSKPQATTQPDGYSGLNITGLFDQLIAGEHVLVCRRARMEDSEKLFTWVNDAAVRHNSIGRKPIEWADHISWLRRKISDGNTLLLVFAIAGELCSQLRYDIINEEATITISVDDQFRGKSLGYRTLCEGERQLRQRHASVNTLIAYVRPENKPSQQLFLRQGFEQAGDAVQLGVSLIQFKKTIKF